MGRVVIAFAVLGVATVARAEVAVVVELVPDNPGPYIGGESLTVDVWLHNQIPGDIILESVRFDFTASHPALELDAAFTFDFSEIPNDIGAYEIHPELPIPWTVNRLACVCPEIFLPVAPDGSLHIGSVGVRIPTDRGLYRLDVLNADEPNEVLGARLVCRLGCLGPPVWRAFSGEITGGAFDFVVSPPIPTLSEWGLMAMGCCLLALGSVLIMRRTRATEDRSRYDDEMPVGNRAPRQAGALRVSALAPLCTAGLSLGAAATLIAQPAPIPSERIAVNIDSGSISALGQGNDAVVVFSEIVVVDSAPWMRLHFQHVELSGSPSTGNGSLLRVTSLQSGTVQVLDSSGVAHWRNTSAYLNGDQVLVELLAHPGSGANRVVIDGITVGVPSDPAGGGIEGICGSDDRVAIDRSAGGPDHADRMHGVSVE